MCQQYDIIPIISTAVVDTGSKFAAGIVDTSGNCYWYQQHQRYWWFATGAVNISSKFAAGGKFSTGLVDTYSPQIFGVIRSDPTVISWAWEKMIHEKNLKQKFS